MSAGHSEPQVLYSVNNIRAYHVQDGQEHEITASGPQTMSLLMVPTSSPYQDSANPESPGSAPEEDFYLHLHLPPELDQPLPATTQIYHKPPSSYLIPRWDLGPESGAFTRIEFPSIGNGPSRVTQEDVDTFETILAQCTAFLERAAPPAGQEKYNPATYRPGEGYLSPGASYEPATPISPQYGQIVLIDEENGSVVGELSDGYNVVASQGVKPGSKNPVEIQLSPEGQGNNITVSNVSEEYLAMSRHPSYQKSTIVQSSAKASRLIVTGSNYLARQMSSGADSYLKKNDPNPKPMTFSPATQTRIRQIHSLTQGAAGMSAKTLGQLNRYAQNIGASITRKGEKSSGGVDKGGNADNDYKPGVLNKSMIAFSTVMDGIDHAGRTLLASGSAAATDVVGHRYGPEARGVASDLTGGVRNVGLVYIDAVGVSRKAVIKSVAKGMVVGKMPNGQQLVVGGGDGGVVEGSALKQTQSESMYGSGQPAPYQAGQGNTGLPPAYTSGGGDSMGAGLQGQGLREKR